jgi:four helix bundle protein
VCQFLREKKREQILSSQVLRSGTGIGANVEEAIGAQSRADFRAKMAIACKEARETAYWLRLLKDTGYLSEQRVRVDSLGSGGNLPDNRIN